MQSRTSIPVALVIVGGTLAACGGGGGGGVGGGGAVHSRPTPFSKVRPIAHAQALGFTSANTNQGPRIGVTSRTSAKGVRIRLPAGTEKEGNYRSSSGNSTTFHMTRTSAAGRGLGDTRYGASLILSGRNSATVGYYTGKATPISQMPSTKSATYRGSLVGYGTSSKHAGTSFTGDVSMTANFGNRSVRGQVSNLRAGGVAQSYGLSMDGRISGNTYSGRTGFTTKSGAATGSTTSNAMSVPFYGATAAETAGAVRIEGRPGTAGAGSVAITGAFGARR